MSEAQKPAVLLLGHGSKAKEANLALYRVAEDLRATRAYALVECAFLEINQPDIPAGLELCKAAGADWIIVMPYFLHLGRHVQEDLPRLIGQWQSCNPELKIQLSECLGYSSLLVKLVQERIRQAALLNPG